MLAASLLAPPLAAESTTAWKVELDAQEPCALAVDRSGRVYVADAARARILVLSPAGEPIRAIGRPGSAPDGRFFEPRGITAGAGFHLIVADTGNARIVRYSTDLDGRAHTFDSVLLERGGLAGGLFRPTSVDFDPAGGLAALDGESHEILILDPFGRLERRIAGFGDLPGRLEAPSALAYDRRRGIFVADAAKIVVFDLFGAHRGDWALPGDAAPGGIALDHRGRLAVALPGEGKVLLFSATGDLTETLTPTAAPIDVAFGPDGGLYVLDGRERTLRSLGEPATERSELPSTSLSFPAKR